MSDPKTVTQPKLPEGSTTSEVSKDAVSPADLMARIAALEAQLAAKPQAQPEEVKPASVKLSNLPLEKPYKDNFGNERVNH